MEKDLKQKLTVEIIILSLVIVAAISYGVINFITIQIQQQPEPRSADAKIMEYDLSLRDSLCQKTGAYYIGEFNENAAILVNKKNITSSGEMKFSPILSRGGIFRQF